MKFRYEYRTSDNIRHTDVVTAKNREAVFLLLSKKGIRPGRVEQLPDAWRKWKLLGWGIGIIIFLVFAILYFAESVYKVRPESRRQLYGDSVRIERGVSSDWRDVLPDFVDKYLARYAQPGWRLRVRPDDEERRSVARVLSTGKEHTLYYSRSDAELERQLKRIVAGMRKEAFLFVKAGGSAERYLELLDERQDKEIDEVVETERRFSKATCSLPVSKLYEIWMEYNRRLSAMGLKTLPMPENILDEVSQ